MQADTIKGKFRLKGLLLAQLYRNSELQNFNILRFLSPKHKNSET